MNLRKTILIPAVTVTALISSLAFAAQARDGAPFCDGHFSHHGMMRGDMGMMDGGMPMPPFIRDLKLTEAQRDQIFKIMHEQAPALRDKAKEVRKARTELRDLAFSAGYDETKVKALADNAAQAESSLTQMRLASAHQIYQLLTPEQRKKADEMKADFEARGPFRAGPPADAPSAPRR